jgi:hypothetical protein
MKSGIFILKFLNSETQRIQKGRVGISVDDWFVLDVHCFASVFKGI